MTDDQAKNARSGWIGGAIIAGIFLAALGVPLFVEFAWPHLHGATPADLARLSLSGSPKAVGRAAPASEVSNGSVRIHMKAGVSEYERVDLDWPSEDTSAPNAMRLRPENGAKQPDVAVALGRWLPLHDGRYEWGAVSFRVDEPDGDARFGIRRTVDGKPNTLFDRQLEAARQVLLNAAFGLPVTVSDAELADTLGTGYAVAAVARSNVFALPLEQGLPFVTAHYPTATGRGSSVLTIPLDHPLIRSVTLRWDNKPGGMITTVELQTTDAYAGARDLFATCLQPRLGAPNVEVSDYAAGKKNQSFKVSGVTLKLDPKTISVRMQGAADAAVWSMVFDAFDGCRESAEGGSRSRRR
jgi:hypothetical protein